MLPFLLICSSVFLATQWTHASEPEKILIIGDSLTAGFGVAKAEAYPALLEKKIQKEYPQKSYQVINAGTSGSTSASAVGRLKWHLQKKPKILILALGANDGLRGTPVESSKKNLADAIDLAQKNNVKVFLAGMKLPMNYGQDYRQQFEDMFASLVKEKKISTIPFLLKDVGGNPALNLADGIHPNEKGHEKIAETVLEAIKGEL